MIVMGKVKLNMGSKIKKLRKAKELSLKAVSEKVGLSPSLLSQIENDKVTPSIATLFKIANFLGKKTSFFLDDYTEERQVESPVVKKKERTILHSKNSRIRYELLNPKLSNAKVEFLEVIVEKGCETGTYTHDGEEYGIILTGKLEVILDGNHYILSRGDSIAFDSSRPHGFRNLSRGETRVIWAISPPTF
jgi:transcriptional regulator with XRE-family HTH domain